MRSARVEHASATDGPLTALVADDETVAMAQRQRSVERHLHAASFAWRQPVTLQHHDARRHVAGAAVQMHRREILQGARFAGQQVQIGIEALGLERRRAAARPGSTPDHILADAGAGEPEGAALPGTAGRRFPVLRVERPHPDAMASGHDREFIPDIDGAGQGRPRHDRSNPRKAESAVDREAKHVFATMGGAQPCRIRQALAERLDAFAGRRGHEQHFASRERGAGDPRRDVSRDDGAACVIDAIAFGDRDDTARQAEQFENLEVFARLRHDSVVAGHNDERIVDPRCAGDHGANETLMAGDIDEADGLGFRSRHVGEAEIDGDASRLLFLEPVRVDAGERAHERRLTVIDVPGRPDDHAAGCMSATRRSASEIACADRRARTLGRKRAASRLPRREAKLR